QHVSGTTGNGNDKTRQPNAVNSGIEHPIEMFIHGLLILGTEQISLRAARIGEAGGGILMGVLAHVGPHLESQSIRRNGAGGPAPMNPLTAAVTWTAKPALITAEDFFPQRCGVHCLVQTKEA